MLQFMGSQRVGHDWATDLIWVQCFTNLHLYFLSNTCPVGCDEPHLNPFAEALSQQDFIFLKNKTWLQNHKGTWQVNSQLQGLWVIFHLLLETSAFHTRRFDELCSLLYSFVWHENKVQCYHAPQAPVFIIAPGYFFIILLLLLLSHFSRVWLCATP